MLYFDEKKLKAIAATIHKALNPSGVVIWTTEGAGMRVRTAIGSPLSGPLPPVLDKKLTLGYLVCELNRTLVFDDTLRQPLLAGSDAIKIMGIMAYVGAPFHFEERAVGGVSAVHQHARSWTASEVQTVENAAIELSGLIESSPSIPTGNS
mgnify:CR=1 FL=1